MPHGEVIQERVRFGEDGRLAGVLHYPESAAPRQAVLLCSPHPNFAGDMDNNVILSLAEHLADQRVVLRFDYRGVGESRVDLPPGLSVLDYWDWVEQTHDYTDALADAAVAVAALAHAAGGLEMAAVGYSFGAVTAAQVALADQRVEAMVCIAPPLTRISFEFLVACSKPCLVLTGDGDFVYDAGVAARLSGAGSGQVKVDTWPGADHFFRGMERDLCRRVAAFVERYGHYPGGCSQVADD